jgi:hypothetical protein
LNLRKQKNLSTIILHFSFKNENNLKKSCDKIFKIFLRAWRCSTRSADQARHGDYELYDKSIFAAIGSS